MYRATALLLAGAVLGAGAVLLTGHLRSTTDAAPDVIDSEALAESTRRPSAGPADPPEALHSANHSHEDRLRFYGNVAGADEQLLRSLIFEAAGLSASRQRRFTGEVLLTRYAELDPQAAVALSQELDFSTSVTASVYAVWVAMDAEAALAAFGAENDRAAAKAIGLAMLDGLGGDETALSRVLRALPPGLDETEFRIEVIAERAESDPGYGIAEALALEKLSDQQKALSKVAAAAARLDPRSAIELGASIADGQHRTAFQGRVMSSWAQSNPEAALEFLTESGLSREEQLTLGRSAMRYIAADDPQRLLAAAEQWSGTMRQQAERTALHYWSQDDPLSALTFVESLPPSRTRDQYISSVASGYAQRDPQGALAWASELQPRPRGLYHSMMSGLAREDPGLAFDTATSLETEADRFEAMQGLIMEAVYRNGTPGEMATRVLALDDGRLRDQSLQMMGSMWVRRDPTGAVAWLSANSSQLPDEIYGSFARELAENDPAAAADLTDRIPVTARPGWIQQVAGGYAERDPEGASNWLSQYQGQPGYDAGVAAIAQQAAERDPVQAARLLTGSSDPQHATAVAGTVGTSWARQDPVSAARWAEGLEIDQARGAAITGVASEWADRDVEAASRWAMQLSRGPDRDAALRSVVSRIASRVVPDSSYFDAFSSDLARQQAAVSAVYRVVRRDPVAARELMRRYVTDATLRTQLEQNLSSYVW